MKWNSLQSCPVQRPHDPRADAIENALLQWLHEHFHGIRPVLAAGTNNLFWQLELKGCHVEFTVLGKLRNKAGLPEMQADWLLRIKEPEVAPLSTELAAFFEADSALVRHLAADTIQVQFKAGALLPDSPLFAAYQQNLSLHNNS